MEELALAETPTPRSPPDGISAALVYVGAMLHGCTEYFIYEYWIGPPPGNAFLFWAINGPYWVIPFMLGVRMWKPDPFSAAPA